MHFRFNGLQQNWAGIFILFLSLSGVADAVSLEPGAEERAWLDAHPVVRLGVDSSYGPYSFLDADGKLQGVVADFIDLIERQLGIRFEIVSDLSWTELMAAVRDKRLDAVATVVRLPEREAFLEFTDIYLPTPLVIMTRAEAPQLHSLADLKAMRIALVKGYSSSQQLLASFPQLRPVFVTTPLEGLHALAAGEVDAYVGVLGVNSFLALKNGITNLKVNAAFDMAENGQRFGVRKDWPELARLLDKALRSIHEEEKIAIFNRWLPRYAGDIERLSQPSLLASLFPWLLGAFGLLLLAYTLVMLWNHRLKSEIAQQRAEMERAQAVAHFGNWSLDPRSGRMEWSNELYRIAGRDPTPAGLDMPTLHSWLHPDSREASDRYVAQLSDLHPGESIPPLVAQLRRPDGEPRWMEVSSAVEFDPEGQPQRFYGSAQDITERRQAEQAVQALNAELEARVNQRTHELQDANQELETFTYSVSHDLKAPLRGIDGYSRLLLEDHIDQLDDEGRLFLRNVRHGVEQMNELIEDLLTYSRMERRTMNSEPIDLKRLLDNVVDEQGAELEKKGVMMTVAMEALITHADPEGLIMVLRNLLDNAMKFSVHSNPPIIDITARDAGEHIVLVIKDNGIGFDMRFHERIFDIFQRLQRAEDYPGTGVGLAIVRKVMQRMGGNIWAESEPGEGATFYLELPK